MPTSASPADRLLVALDVPSLEEADALLGRLDGIITGCKIGSQLFTAAGPAAIETLLKGEPLVLSLQEYHADLR